jgi:pimeloyl-ACP methyl ester carboxylesterase
VVTVADALGWDTFSLMAHSMGVGIAILLAGAVPSRLNHLILLDAVGFKGVEPEQAPKLLEISLKERHRLLSRQSRVYENIEQVVDRMIEKAVTRLERPNARLLVERSAERVKGGGWRFRHDPKLAGSGRMFSFTEPQVLAFIKRISCPTLLIWATTRSFHMDMKTAETHIKNFRNITVTTVEGNHHVHLEEEWEIEIEPCCDLSQVNKHQ